MDNLHTKIGMILMQNLATRLQLKDFRLIQAISETGQLALAAERLAMTQPAASRMLAGIERAVGTPLFWLAYLRDLATVAASDVRPQPGLAVTITGAVRAG